jgi:hypothetical protein
MYSQPHSANDVFLHEYMQILSGTVDSEKLEFIKKEREQMTLTLSLKDEMDYNYINRIISDEEYLLYLDDYIYSFARNEFFCTIEFKTDYLEFKMEETGVQGWFLYDTGWLNLLFPNFDIILPIIFIIIFAGVFADEYSEQASNSGFSTILMCSKNGRNRTFNKKIISVFIIATVLYIISSMVDFVFINKYFDLSNSMAPLFSIEKFSAISSNITISHFIAIFYLIRYLCLMVFCSFICLVSQVSKRIKITLAIMMLFIIIEMICYNIEIEMLNIINYLKLLDFSNVIINIFKAIRVSEVFIIGLITFILIIILSLTLKICKKQYVN